MKRTIQCFLLMAGLSLSAVAQPEPVQTVSDFGLKGPVKRVSELNVTMNRDGEYVFWDHVIEFDRQGRRSDGYAYDGKGRLVVSFKTYYDEYHRPVVSNSTYYSYDQHGRLTSEQIFDNGDDVTSSDYYVYTYDKNGRLISCACYGFVNEGKRNDKWVKTYQYDKQGRLMGAEAKTPDKKNPKLDFSYQVLYAADGTPKNYLYTYNHGPWYDEYGEIVKGSEMVTDTLPCNEWAFYAINHNTKYNRHQEDGNIQWTKFDDHGNGVEWKAADSTRTEPEYDEYGEKINDGHDTVLFYNRSRTIEYYDEYDINVSATEMNVLYCGIENPVKITVQGVPDEFVVVGDEDNKSYSVWRDEISGGGNYVIEPRVKMGLIRIPVKAIVDGRLKKVGEYVFRVRTVPDPKLYLGKYESGSTIPIAEFINMKNVAVRMSSDFAFRMKIPKVVRQEMAITQVKGADDLETKTADWNPEILSYVQKAKPGSKVDIEVTFEMPDGSKRIIPGQWNLAK